MDPFLFIGGNPNDYLYLLFIFNKLPPEDGNRRRRRWRGLTLIRHYRSRPFLFAPALLKTVPGDDRQNSKIRTYVQTFAFSFLFFSSSRPTRKRIISWVDLLNENTLPPNESVSNGYVMRLIMPRVRSDWQVDGRCLKSLFLLLFIIMTCGPYLVTTEKKNKAKRGSVVNGEAKTETVKTKVSRFDNDPFFETFLSIPLKSTLRHIIYAR